MRTIDKLAPLKALKDVPNCGDQRAVRALMESQATKEERDAECFAWAAALGAWCWHGFQLGNKDAMMAIGRALEGTPARAAWDLDGPKAGVKRAVIILAADSAQCSEHWMNAFMTEEDEENVDAKI